MIEQSPSTLTEIADQLVTNAVLTFQRNLALSETLAHIARPCMAIGMTAGIVATGTAGGRKVASLKPCQKPSQRRDCRSASTSPRATRLSAGARGPPPVAACRPCLI